MHKYVKLIAPQNVKISAKYLQTLEKSEKISYNSFKGNIVGAKEDMCVRKK